MNHALVVAKIDQVAVDVNASALAEKQTLLGFKVTAIVFSLLTFYAFSKEECK